MESARYCDVPNTLAMADEMVSTRVRGEAVGEAFGRDSSCDARGEAAAVESASGGLAETGAALLASSGPAAAFSSDASTGSSSPFWLGALDSSV